MQFPDRLTSADSLKVARERFHRVLGQWACDLLSMQARGERSPRWVSGSTSFAAPVKVTALPESRRRAA